MIAQLYPRLVRWAFHRFYREFAWTYDTVAAIVSGGHWRAWAQAPAALVRGATLELGCGTGHLQQRLAGRSGCRTIGLDASPSMLAIARRRGLRHGCTFNLTRADARALPFPAVTFDTVVATFPSEYIVAPETIAEIARVLRPGGRLVVALWAEFATDSLYHRIVDLAYRITLQQSPRGAAAPPASGRLDAALAQAGFALQHMALDTPGGVVQTLVGEAPR
jgi:ubiquinone/menaquinone biosynthesis C-methylase UbiE